jgi:hypothetical protein
MINCARPTSVNSTIWLTQRVLKTRAGLRRIVPEFMLEFPRLVPAVILLTGTGRFHWRGDTQPMPKYKRPEPKPADPYRSDALPTDRPAAIYYR